MQIYLGRRYVLKIIEDADALPSVKMTRGKLLVTLTRFNEDKPHSSASKELVQGSRRTGIP
ncbi:hypothetical protein BCU23_02845 [Vibrio splendidus]|nr:hypothetical protein BCU23_02845 [Vibrio splendidus]